MVKELLSNEPGGGALKLTNPKQEFSAILPPNVTP